jgi:ubiquinone/menaquinone biosynthesis C-methylase UbiE
VLEAGVGTGKNMPFYPPELDITAIDLTPGMLERARLRAQNLNISPDLQLGDVQALEFPDASFDTCTTFVFCSVPDLFLGYANWKGGAWRVLLLEHALTE